MVRPTGFEPVTYRLEGGYSSTELRANVVHAISFEPVCLLLSVVLNNNGGNGEIRTHGGFTPSTVFKTATLNHSVTFPSSIEKLRNGTTGGIRTHNGLSSRVYETRASNRRASVALILVYYFTNLDFLVREAGIEPARLYSHGILPTSQTIK